MLLENPGRNALEEAQHESRNFAIPRVKIKNQEKIRRTRKHKQDKEKAFLHHAVCALQHMQVGVLTDLGPQVARPHEIAAFRLLE